MEIPIYTYIIYITNREQLMQVPLHSSGGDGACIGAMGAPYMLAPW
jgi:hypothetical protein